LVMDLANVPSHPTRWYTAYWGDLNGDSETDLQLTFESLITEWSEYPYVAVTLRFFGPGIVFNEFPASLSSFDSELHIASEGGSYSDYGFSLLGTLEVANTSGLQGVDSELSLDEETSTSIDIPGLYSGVQVVPGSIEIVEGPTKGNLLVNTTTGRVTYTPFANAYGQDSFSYTIQDVDGNTSSVGTIAITIDEIPEPYQNPLAKSRPDGMYYVNYDDEIVSALDAVYIIIELNATGPHALTAPPEGTIIRVYFDVNGDNFLAALDALLVIIRLNAGGSGEGVTPESAEKLLTSETTAAASAPPPSQAIEAATESVFLLPGSLALREAKHPELPRNALIFTPPQRAESARAWWPVIAEAARPFRARGQQRADAALAEESDWLWFARKI
jgi:hypothetical protein